MIRWTVRNVPLRRRLQMAALLTHTILIPGATSELSTSPSFELIFCCSSSEHHLHPESTAVVCLCSLPHLGSVAGHGTIRRSLAPGVMDQATEALEIREASCSIAP